MSIFKSREEKARQAVEHIDAPARLDIDGEVTLSPKYLENVDAMLIDLLINPKDLSAKEKLALDDIANSVKVLSKVQAMLRELKKASDVPYVELVDWDAPTVKERYDWNSAFIKMLTTKHGYTGTKAEEIMETWERAKVEQGKKMVTEQVLKDKKNSNEFWVSVEGSRIVDDKIELTLDYNAVAVKTLRAQGFSGSTDEEVVQSFVSSLSRDLQSDDNYK